MSTNQVSKAANRTLALTYRDGLVDLLLGIFFTLLALQEPLELQGWPVWLSYLPSIGAMVIGLVIYAVLKRRVVAPRIGVANISVRRNPPRRNILIFAVVLQLVTLLIFILASSGWLSEYMPARPGWLIDAFFAVATFAFFAFMAYTIDARRFYLYGVVLASTMLIQPSLRGDMRLVAQLPVMFAGLVMVVGGAIALSSFLREFPVVEMEDTHD
jgi:hypothetical protein